MYKYGIKYVESYDGTSATQNLEPFGRGIERFSLYLITPNGKFIKYTPSLGKDTFNGVDIGDSIPHTKEIPSQFIR